MQMRYIEREASYKEIIIKSVHRLLRAKIDEFNQPTGQERITHYKPLSVARLKCSVLKRGRGIKRAE